MSTKQRPTLQEYLNFKYSFSVIADQDDGGFVIVFPDLPGCMTQVEDVSEIPEMAEDVRQLWIETAYEDGIDIPLPSYPGEYSGKFNVRIPRSLHRRLAESAKREGVSLNQHVVALLSEKVAVSQILDLLKHESRPVPISRRDRFRVIGAPPEEPGAKQQHIGPQLKVVESDEPIPESMVL